MATQSVTVARIYLREGEHLLSKVITFLHEEEQVSGVTVLQGMMGFGPDGEMRTSRLLDLSMDLPLVIEFYDLPERVESVINHLQTHMGLSHVVSWPAISHIIDTAINKGSICVLRSSQATSSKLKNKGENGYFDL